MGSGSGPTHCTHEYEALTPPPVHLTTRECTHTHTCTCKCTRTTHTCTYTQHTTHTYVRDMRRHMLARTCFALYSFTRICLNAHALPSTHPLTTCYSPPSQTPPPATPPLHTQTLPPSRTQTPSPLTHIPPGDPRALVEIVPLLLDVASLETHFGSMTPTTTTTTLSTSSSLSTKAKAAEGGRQRRGSRSTSGGGAATATPADHATAEPAAEAAGTGMEAVAAVAGVEGSSQESVAGHGPARRAGAGVAADDAPGVGREGWGGRMWLGGMGWAMAWVYVGG